MMALTLKLASFCPYTNKENTDSVERMGGYIRGWQVPLLHRGVGECFNDEVSVSTISKTTAEVL